MTCFTLFNIYEVNEITIDENILQIDIDKHRNDEVKFKKLSNPIYPGDTHLMAVDLGYLNKIH